VLVERRKREKIFGRVASIALIGLASCTPQKADVNTDGIYKLDGRICIDENGDKVCQPKEPGLAGVGVEWGIEGFDKASTETIESGEFVLYISGPDIFDIEADRFYGVIITGKDCLAPVAINTVVDDNGEKIINLTIPLADNCSEPMG
jgi:hypothetical protein